MYSLVRMSVLNKRPPCAFDGGALKPQCIAAASPRSFSLRCATSNSTTQARRSANYKPPFWDFNYIQSFTTQYTEERYATRAAELIAQVKMLLQQQMEVVPRLELIDDLQRLGISHHFRHQIDQILTHLYFEHGYFNKYDVEKESMDLYSTALAFRLLREHGFQVSQHVFERFKNENGDFRASLGNDTRGVLQLYEASFLLTHGEQTLELAKEFATDILQKKVDDNLAISHALELPIHWRIQRPNARGFIEAYRRRPQMNPIVYDLAELDFNIVQAMHQQELKLISRWWKQTRISEKLPFARDRVVECYMWALAQFPPEYRYANARMMATKANILITIIDDIFDVYATLEELQLFNTVIQRWDVGAMDQLPNYMQICFLTLNNLINEMAYDVLKDQDVLIIQHLRKSWSDLFKSFIQEAQWQAAGYTPTLQQYLSNAWISSSVPVMLSHAFFLITNPIHKEAVESLYKYHNLVQCPAMLLRLANDLATSQNEMERGEVAGCVECYMKETGASRDEGGEHARFMIWETWKSVNQQRVGDYEFSKEFIRSAVDLGRMAQYMYQLGDGHGIQNPQIKDRISCLLFEPIRLVRITYSHDSNPNEYGWVGLNE